MEYVTDKQGKSKARSIFHTKRRQFPLFWLRLSTTEKFRSIITFYSRVIENDCLIIFFTKQPTKLLEKRNSWLEIFSFVGC